MLGGGYIRLVSLVHFSQILGMRFQIFFFFGIASGIGIKIMGYSIACAILRRLSCGCVDVWMVLFFLLYEM